MSKTAPSNRLNSARALSDSISREKRKERFLKSLKYRAFESCKNAGSALAISAVFLLMISFYQSERDELKVNDFSAVKALAMTSSMIDGFPKHEIVSEDIIQFAEKISADNEFSYEDGFLSTNIRATCEAAQDSFPKIELGKPKTKNAIGCESRAFYSKINLNIAGEAQ